MLTLTLNFIEKNMHWNKIRVTLIAFTFCVPLALNADVTSETDYFNLLCAGSESVGFAWDKGSWQPTSYKPGNHIVQKVEIEHPPVGQIGKKSGGCSRYLNDLVYPWELEDTISIQGCYNIRTTGSEFKSISSQICVEEWAKKSDGSKTLSSVSCENFNFTPTGWFHTSYIHDNVSKAPKETKKDSMYVEVGQCSKL